MSDFEYARLLWYVVLDAPREFYAYSGGARASFRFERSISWRLGMLNLRHSKLQHLISASDSTMTVTEAVTDPAKDVLGLGEKPGKLQSHLQASWPTYFPCLHLFGLKALDMQLALGEDIISDERYL